MSLSSLKKTISVLTLLWDSLSIKLTVKNRVGTHLLLLCCLSPYFLLTWGYFYMPFLYSCSPPSIIAAFMHECNTHCTYNDYQIICLSKFHIWQRIWLHELLIVKTASSGSSESGLKVDRQGTVSIRQGRAMSSWREMPHYNGNSNVFQNTAVTLQCITTQKTVKRICIIEKPQILQHCI
jgi:hypothetical protein